MKAEQRLEEEGWAKECRQTLEAAKGKKTNSPLEPSEETPSVETLIFTYKTHYRLPEL